MNVHFSSKNQEWETPNDIFNKLNEIFMFNLDVCASDDNYKVPEYYTKLDDGLLKNWYGVCWMNPPYGRSIYKWMNKAYESSLNGCTIVCLVPSRTDTKWWHNYAMKGQIVFIKGRLKFGGSLNNAPFPSALVVFGDYSEDIANIYKIVNER